MSRLLPFLKKYRVQVFLGPAFKLIEAIFELLIPLVMASVIDDGVALGNKNIIIQKGLLIVILSVTGFCSTLVCQYFASVASQGFGTELRNGLFAKVGTFSDAELDRFGSSTLLSRITNDVDKLQKGVAMLIRLAVRVPFLIIGAVIMSFIVNAKAALIITASVPFIAIIARFVIVKSVPYLKEARRRTDSLVRISGESLDGTRVIRAFSANESVSKRFSDENDLLSEASERATGLSALLNPLTYIVVNLGIAAILHFGGADVYAGSLSQGELMALISYMSQISVALVVASDLVTIFTAAGASASRVCEVLAAESSVKNNGGTFGDSKEHPLLSFENVSFSYPSGAAALHNVSFSADRGEIIGFIGVTGSGKSTLLSLIPRFYDVTEGSVFIDGTDIRSGDITELRRRVSLVPQKPALLSGTVRGNLKLARQDADDNLLYDCLKASSAYDFVIQKGGLDYVIEQGGKNLSGGQKRRLTIARALAAEPRILILDDSFTGLDSLTEKNVRLALAEKCRKNGSLMIIASQRVTSLRNCDRIYVMDDGQIAGCGTHDELISGCEIYRSIYSSQTEENGGANND